MLQRRDVLKLGALSLAAAPGLARAQAENPSSSRFDASGVLEAARALAGKPFRPPSTNLPDVFANLSAEQYAAIVNRSGSAVWAADNVGFMVEPLHRGSVFASAMRVNVVEDGAARRLTYSPNDFDFGGLKVPGDVADIGFSGFRLSTYPPDGDPTPVAVFQGGSFYQAIARGMIFGPRSRGLALKVADPKGEEIPLFREVWIEKPTLAQGAIVIHALLDSESLTGAYRITLRSAEATIIDTECTLFTRVAVDNIGVAPMTATYLAGALDRRRVDDVRPNVHDFDGLQILNGRGEWLWRPVSNRETLQTSAFVDENPRGFGFLQRDRDFARFLDDQNAWEKRPSLWVEPIGDWGPGAVNLIEVPSDSDVNQNMIAFWRPNGGLAAGSETSFAYRQFWCWSPPAAPPGAIVTASRGGRAPGGGGNSRRRRFLVQFTGDGIADGDAARDIVADLHAGPGAIVGAREFRDSARKARLIEFDLDPGAESLCEMRLYLKAGGAVRSEVWLYRWTA